MPKMIVSIDGVVIKEVQLTRERTTLGRRPYNDLVIDNLAVSGEHAVFTLEGNDVQVEDLNSTNGTYVNGKAIKKHMLANGDLLEIGKYKIRYIGQPPEAGFDKTMVMRPGSMPPPMPTAAAAAEPEPAAAPAAAELNGVLEVLNGPATGREVALVKVVTTLGKPGVAVASITRRPSGFSLALVEGETRPTVNSHALGDAPVTLTSGDVIELAGTKMRFIQR